MSFSEYMHKSFFLPNGYFLRELDIEMHLQIAIFALACGETFSLYSADQLGGDHLVEVQL